jgi:hypothetical protein
MATPLFPIVSPARPKIYAPQRQQSGMMTNIYGTNTTDAASYSISQVTKGDVVLASKLELLATTAISERIRRGGPTVPGSVPIGYYGPDGNDVYAKIFANRITDIRTQIERKGPVASQAYNYGPDQGINSPEGRVVTGYTEVLAYYTKSGPVYTTQPTYSPVADPTVVVYPQAAAPSMTYTFTAKDKITAQNINDLITEINNAGAVCLCNCNYCTCNCNYCTCNCNYTCTCNCNY